MNPLHRSRAILVTVIGALTLLALPGAAAAKFRDRNHDRIPDRWEKRHHLSLNVKQTWRDQDHDHLSNRQEFLAGTNPRKRDSNGDGIPDGNENAGTIQSFDPETGRLVIDLFGKETVSGLVTEETEIECAGTHATSSEVENEGNDSEGEAQSPEGEGGQSEGVSDDSSSESEDANEHEGSESAEHGECTAEDLVEGAIVREARLTLEKGTATFEKVELAG